MRPFQLALPFTLLLFCGCIPHSETIAVLPEKPAPAALVPGANRSRLQVRVTDQRTDIAGQPLESPQQVGFARGMAGERTRPDYVCAEPVPETFARQLREELAARGFMVADPSPVRVSLGIRQFQLDFKGHLNSRWVGEVAIDVAVARGDGPPEYSRRIATSTEAVHSDLWPLWEDSHKQGGRTLGRAMAEVLGILFKDEKFLSCLAAEKTADAPARP